MSEIVKTAAALQKLSIAKDVAQILQGKHPTKTYNDLDDLQGRMRALRQQLAVPQRTPKQIGETLHQYQIVLHDLIKGVETSTDIQEHRESLLFTLRELAEGLAELARIAGK